MSYTNGRVALHNTGGCLSGLVAPKTAASPEVSPYIDALTGGWNDTELSCSFFSADNINNLQSQLHEGVKKKSKGQYLIGRQDDDELKTIMRSIYLQYAENRCNDLTGQLQKLNRLVLDYAVGQVYGEAQGYLKYLRDAGTMYSDGGALLPNPVAPDNLCRELEFGKRSI